MIDLRKNNSVVVLMIAGKPACKTLRNNMLPRFKNKSFVQNANKLVVNCFSAPEFFFDEQESVVLGLYRKNIINVNVQHWLRDHNTIRKNFAEI